MKKVIGLLAILVLILGCEEYEEPETCLLEKVDGIAHIKSLTQLDSWMRQAKTIQRVIVSWKYYKTSECYEDYPLIHIEGGGLMVGTEFYSLDNFSEIVIGFKRPYCDNHAYCLVIYYP